MSRRSISDEEIGLIKALLERGVRNRDIQFYFNKPDRPVNSGRISQIRSGTYGREVPSADASALDAFLARHSPAEVGVVLELAAHARQPTVAELARQRFSQHVDGHWQLTDGENHEQECKETFDSRRISPIVRAIAALANNRGGFIFFGIANTGCRVVGLPDGEFSDVDIATIADRVKTYLTPTPSFTKILIEVGGLNVGVVHVEPHRHRPIIVCRDGEGLEDGAILFRYPGQSGRVKFGDLLEMLRERDQAAQEMLLTGAARLSQIGADRALIVDTQEATVDAGGTRITIDRSLADQLEFIREGEFEERSGAPTLRLVGDVHAVDAEGQVGGRIEGRAIAPDMVVKAYLRRERVRSPLEYVRVSALTQRQWLPLHYFVRMSGQGIGLAIEALEQTQASNQQSKLRALERLRGERTAYVPLSGHASPVGAEIAADQIEGLCERYDPVLIARAIQGLPESFCNIPPLLEILDSLHDSSVGNSALRGHVYRAISRLDEIEALSGTDQPFG